MKKRKQKNYILIFALIAICALGIGYATVNGIPLTIGGNASVSVPDIFEVVFDDVDDTYYSTNIEEPSNIVITADIIDDLNAEFDVTGMQGYGDTATVVYSIVNNSTLSSASFSISTANNNTEYFDVTTTLTDSNSNNIATLNSGATGYVSVKVKVKKVSTSGPKTATIGITITATQN